MTHRGVASLALTPGTRLGAFEVTALLGVGGMGQVYRATDTTLGRQVAIKILPDTFASDPERVARFEREAKTLASLNHPNIAAIYGFEKSTSLHALVMELVEGEDLSQRIARGAIPLDEALPIAKQIAEALEAAHEQGVIHRDLKPANLKVRIDGTVKVLDFGLAKAMDPVAESSAAAMETPTITSPAMTMRGMILGTAAYMAPEQAKGKPVDRRADVWAFGAVLYEMLTGQRAFKGEDTTDTIAAVVSKEPDWSALPVNTPAAIRKLLRRCLEKDRRRRLADAADARLEIEDAMAAPLALDGAITTGAPSSPARARLAWSVAMVSVVAATALAVPALRHLRETPPPAPAETRLEISTPGTDSPASFALSPDGRQIVFAASGDGPSRLWLRSLSTTTAQPLAGTEGATLPFWSSDGRSLGFFAGGALKRLDLEGGAPQTLAPATSARGGTWNEDGVILFAPSTSGPLMRVSASGGAATAVTTLGPQQQRHSRPGFLPDGRFLFDVGGAAAVAGIYAGTLDGSPPIGLSNGPGGAAAFHASGSLLWLRAGTLMGQRFDLSKTSLVGEPVTVADGVAGVSVAATGLVAYRTAAISRRQLTWVDRSGTARGTAGDVDGSLLNPRVSPDGRRVVVDRSVQGNRDLWLLDGVRTSRFTFDAAIDMRPAWSPDGTRIVFSSNRTGRLDLYEKLTSGAGVEERLVGSDQTKNPTSWSADGRFLLFHSLDPQTDLDLWVVPMALRPSTDASDRTPSVVLKTPARELQGVFSPDGRWVAYMSGESGRNEIYVRPFGPPSRAASADKPGGQWQVSTAGGIMPAWRPDGKELYFLNPEGAMMAAAIAVTGTTLEPGAPALLFSTRVVGGGVDAVQGRQYDVAPDGRFLINTELDSAAVPITVLMNWSPDAKK